MRLRWGFVSNSSSSSCILANSSSSSCILANSRILTDVTAADVQAALDSWFDSERLREHRERLASHPDEDQSPLYRVFGLDTAEGVTAADSYWGDTLDLWVSAYALLDHSGYPLSNPDAAAALCEWHDTMRDLDELPEAEKYFRSGGKWCGGATPYRHLLDAHPLFRYQEETGEFTYRAAPPGLLEMARKLWNRLRLCTNRDALVCPSAKVFIHFDDNEIYGLYGMSDDSGWISEPMGEYRFLEVLLFMLQDRGLVDRIVSPQEFRDTCVLAMNIHEG